MVSLCASLPRARAHLSLSFIVSPASHYDYPHQCHQMQATKYDCAVLPVAVDPVDTDRNYRKAAALDLTNNSERATWRWLALTLWCSPSAASKTNNPSHLAPTATCKRIPWREALSVVLQLTRGTQDYAATRAGLRPLPIALRDSYFKDAEDECMQHFTP
ncbi:hypothetical protein C8R43DRAFT_1134470 [Mycena crocata]|nr:hypothetical protein C8R43DRAFT_1134470 [Mycena crocata]